jgi:hypothetical protein
MKRKILLKEAKIISNKVKKEYLEKGIKLIQVGSIARKVAMVSDIDFITSDDLGAGRKYIVFNYPTRSGHVQVDIWHAEKENFKLAKDLRSYPAYYVIGLRKKLNPKGYHLSDQELLKGNEKIKYQGFQWLTQLAGVVYHPLSYYAEE